MNPDNITPPQQPQLPAHHVTNSMKVVMLLLGIVLVITLGYFTWFVGSEQEATEEVAPSVKDETEETATTETTTDETADWKTYTNATYNYSYKYPSDWTNRERANIPEGMAEPWKSYLFYSSYTKPAGQDHQGFVAVSKKLVSELKQAMYTSGTTLTEETVTFAEVQATKVTAKYQKETGTGYDYFVVRGEYVYVITGPIAYATDSDTEVVKTQEELLKSFKFIN